MTVNVWAWPISFDAVGAIVIFALTKVLTASPLFRRSWSVWTVNCAEPATDSVEAAWPVTLPACSR